MQSSLEDFVLLKPGLLVIIWKNSDLSLNSLLKIVTITEMSCLSLLMEAQLIFFGRSTMTTNIRTESITAVDMIMAEE